MVNPTGGHIVSVVIPEHILEHRKFRTNVPSAIWVCFHQEGVAFMLILMKKLLYTDGSGR